MADLFLQNQRTIGGVRPNAVGIREIFFLDRRAVHRFFPEEPGQQQVFILHVPGQLFPKGLFVEKVTDADAGPGDLVLVSRPDPPAGRPDFCSGFVGFPGNVDPAMVGHDDVGGFADEEPGIVGKQSVFPEPVQLLHHDPRVHNHTVADDADLSRMKDPRGNQVQDGLSAPDHEGVSGIVAPLKSYDHIGMSRVEIDDLPFSLITPLGADHNHV